MAMAVSVPILHPKFDPLKVAWMEQGGIYAVANLRGGTKPA